MAAEGETDGEREKLEEDSVKVKDEKNEDPDKENEGKTGDIEEAGKEDEVKEEEPKSDDKDEEAENGEESPEKESNEDELMEEDGDEDGKNDDAKSGDEIKEKESENDKEGEIEQLSSPRPTRVRKTVERFMVDETPKGSASKPFTIEKGQGTQLKDIPNVAFKLSRRKADENLQILHAILFGKRAKVQTLKKHLGLFCGFVWNENEQEKQRNKVRDKIDKCVKEKLLDFCDLLNIPINKATTKKEELSSKLLEFLESPYATTDNLLADKEKGKKRMSKGSGKSLSSIASVGKSAKKQKLDSESAKKEKPSDDEDSNHRIGPSKSEDDKDDDSTGQRSESGHGKNDSEEETDADHGASEKKVVEEKGSSSKKTAKEATGTGSAKPKTISKAGAKSNKNSAGSASKKRASEGEPKGKTKAPPAKKQNVEKEANKHPSSPSSKKKSSKGERPSSRKVKKRKEPTREEMHARVADILKEVDFNTATLSDILRQLGEHFKVDLVHRKSEIKDIITDVISNMSDDDEEENEPGDSSGNEEADD